MDDALIPDQSIYGNVTPNQTTRNRKQNYKLALFTCFFMQKYREAIMGL